MRSKRSNLIGKALRKANALLTCMTLTYATLPADVLAQSRVEKNSDITNAALSIIGGMKNVANQNMAQQMSPAQIQAMSAFNEFRTDAKNKIGMSKMGMPKHYMFTNCAVPPDTGLRPVSICSSSSVSPELMAESMLIAQEYIKMYDGHLRAQNSASPSGMQCIQNTMKGLADQATTLIAEFDKMVADFEAQRKEIENQQQANLRKITDTHAMLNGTKGKSSQDMKNMDFRKMFPKECTDIMGEGALNGTAKSGGLLAVRDSLSNTDEKAANFRGRSLSVVKSQIEKDKKLLQDKIKKNGFSALSSSTLLTGVKFKGVFTKALQDSVTPMNEDIQKANALLSELGVADSIPSLQDPSFEIKMNTILNNASNSYKDQFVLDCMKGNNAAAYSSPLTSIIGNFNHRVANNQGTTIDNFKTDANSAINTSTTISALESEMKSLSNEQIKVNVRNENNQKVSKTLDQYFADIKSECVSIYNGDMKPAGSVGALENYKQQSEKAKSQLTTIKDDMDKMLVSKNGTGQNGSIEALVDDLINNCGGVEVEATDCSKKSVYEKSSPSFCVKRATTCSSLVNSCNQQATAYVDKKTQELKVMADQYNAQMKVLEDNANKMTQLMNTRLEQMAVSLNDSLFPKSMPPELRALYGIPTFSGLPQDQNVQSINIKAEDKAFPGLFIKGNGVGMKDIGEQLIKNKELLKRNFTKYVEDQASYAEKIVEANQSQWQEESEKWKDFRNECQSTLAEMKSGAIEQQQEMAQTQQEADGKRLQFCQKYAAMTAAPGCDGDFSPEALYSEAIEISSHLGQDVFGALDQYRNLCLESQNEGVEDDSAKSNNHIKEACARNGNSASSVISEFETNMLAEIPAAFEDYEDKIKEYLKADKDSDITLKSIHEDLPKSSFANKLKSLKKMYSFNSKNNIQIGNISSSVDENTKSEREAAIRNAASNAEVSLSESDEGHTNFCSNYGDFISYRRVSNCANELSKSDDKSEAQKKVTSCLNEDESHSKAVKSVLNSQKFGAINNSIGKLANSGKSSAWSDIGEKTGGTSCAHIAGGRQFGGNMFEQMFDSDNAGGDSNPFGMFR
ncbi:MAG: hypothetical protein BM556_00060 [Bacteriovorax sp. MedPE-SWde]|nr:MAG: hypothetical protein BM556_00060 [Bacteriovorax sp. MedPE-SWde]